MMWFKRFAKERVPQNITRDLLDTLMFEDLLLVGGRGSGRSRFLAQLSSRAHCLGQPVVSVTSSVGPLNEYGVEYRYGDEVKWQCAPAIVHLNVDGRTGPKVMQWLDHALRGQLELFVRSSYISSRIVLVLDETAGYLSAALSQYLSLLHQQSRMVVWLAQSQPLDFNDSPLINPMLEQRTRVAFPWTRGGGSMHQRLLHPVTLTAVSKAKLEPFKYCDIVVERRWQPEMFRNPYNFCATADIRTAPLIDPKALTPTSETPLPGGASW
jgi:hypothetical protein